MSEQVKSIRKLLRRVARLCRRVASADLAGFPVYVVPTSQLPPEFGDRCEAAGYTGRDLDLLLREHLQAAGEWKGRGVAMALNDVELLKKTESARAREALSIGLHELAHTLREGHLSSVREDRPLAPKAISAQIGTFAQCLSTAAGMRELVAKDDDAIHDSQFFRVAIHLAYRAERRAAFMADLPSMIGCGLRTTGYYEGILAGECAKLRKLAIADVLKLPPPKAWRVCWPAGRM